MAATRNKFMYSDFCASTHQMMQQKEYIMSHNPYVNERPAWAVRCNNPRLPGTLLASNSIDIESQLYGIGANNFIFPTNKVTPNNITLQPLKFYEEPNVYVPVLPDFYKNQRPF